MSSANSSGQQDVCDEDPVAGRPMAPLLHTSVQSVLCGRSEAFFHVIAFLPKMVSATEASVFSSTAYSLIPQWECARELLRFSPDSKWLGC